MILSCVLGLIIALLLYFGAKSLAVQFGKPGLETPLRILAPTTFIVAVLGCFRGYFQGFGNMVPTAISQIAEQVINAVVSILASSQVTLIISSGNKAELRAAGGTMGTLAGAFVSLMIIAGLYIKTESHKSEKLTIASDEAKLITKSLFFVMIPIILSQTVYQIGFTLDDFIFAKIMGAKGFDETYVTNIQGVFNTQYNQLINLPVGIATAFGVSVLPRISKAIANKNKVQADKNICELVKMNSLIVFPAAIGLSICSDEIMQVLFPTLGKLQPLAVNLICYGSIAAVFYSFSTISASILQGGNRFKVPVINSAISLSIHVVLVVVLLMKTNLQVYALLIGDIVFPLILLILNWRVILKVTHPKIKFKENVVKPLLGAVIMGLMVIITKIILKNIGVGYLIKLILEVSVGGLSYILFVLKNKIVINKR